MFNKILKFFNNFFKKSQSVCMQSVDEVGVDAAKKPVKYYLNDPAFPELTGFTTDAAPYKLKINVKGFNGSGAPFETLQGKAANVFATLQQGINIVNGKMNLDKWAVVQTLNVDPLAGVQPNAYYDRQNLKFFYFNSQGKEIYTALSADIVSHEMGHAFLDAIRPEFFNMASMEVWALHESFGDIIAVICSLSHDEVIKVMIDQTGGDLRKSNLVEGLAEQFGLNLGMKSALRKAINNFVYVKPETLPQRAPDDQLCAEPHSFSRVFTAAFYDTFCESVKALGPINIPNIKNAINILSETFYEACKLCPSAANIFSVLATNWINILNKNNPKIAEIARQCFTSRQILGTVHAMNYSGQEYKFDKKLITSFGIEGTRFVKYECDVPVLDLFSGDVVVQSETMNEIMALNIKLPVDEYFVRQDIEPVNICASMSEACEAAKYFISYLVDQDKYGNMENQSWHKDNKDLARKYFACNCYMNNCLTSGNPEYGKCWKPKNNTGCCSYGNNEPKIEPKIEKTCNLRYSSSCGRINYKGNC